MGILEIIFGDKKIVIPNCSRDPNDPRVSRCDVVIQESGGIVRRGQIAVIGDNKKVYPLSTGNLSPEDFNDAVKFLNSGGWQKIVPNIKSAIEKSEE